MNATPPDSADMRPIQPPQPSGLRIATNTVTAVLLLALAAGAYWWWQGRRPAVVPDAPAPATAAADAASAAQPAEPEIAHPIDSAGSTAALPPLAQSDATVTRELTELLGNKRVLSLLQTDGFVRRVVATVDNLDRTHAAPRLWPVVPTNGRFTVLRVGDAEFIAPANAARYAPFVSLVESVDTARAAALYIRLYPLFQQAYQELGYPRGYLNDRLVAVIDRLLATPEPSGPIAVQLTEVKGPIKSERPWVRYEFADPALEALPAGSKMLLRMGPDNARRLKAKLTELRRAVAGPPPRKP